MKAQTKKTAKRIQKLVKKEKMTKEEFTEFCCLMAGKPK